MTRYRNFKTLTTPRPVQLSCVTVDSSGDLIAAGGKDVFEVYLWSLTTGRLVEVLGGHEGPVGGVAFSPCPSSTMLATVSWDKTLRVWDAISSTATRYVLYSSYQVYESIQLNSRFFTQKVWVKIVDMMPCFLFHYLYSIP